MQNTILLLLISFVISTAGITPRSPHSIKETHLIPRQWKAVGRAPAGYMLNLQIGLKQNQFHKLERHLYEGTIVSLLKHEQ